jgi:ABC-type branched-subunit amino acid transport system ATPase component
MVDASRRSPAKRRIGPRPHDEPEADAVTSLLEVEGVEKAFGGLRALSGCSLRVEKGSITGLIGPNGSGKTTLFNVITGYVKPDAGTVVFEGTDITGATPSKVFALGVGRTFQITRIFARISVLENMLVATQRDESWLRGLTRSKSSKSEVDAAMEWLDFVGIARLASLTAGALSFGQRKLLELAYVLVADPDVILLDEPAGGVNLTLINEIAEKIRTLNASGKTFLIVEHNMEFVMNLCDTVTVMHQGVDLVAGTPDDVRRNPHVLDAYLGGSDDDEEEVAS